MSNKPRIRTAIIAVQSAQLVSRGDKQQVEVIDSVTGFKLHTWNSGVIDQARPLVGRYAAVDYHDKLKPYPGEFLLDQIRPISPAEAATAQAGTALKLEDEPSERPIAAGPPALADVLALAPISMGDGSQPPAASGCEVASAFASTSDIALRREERMLAQSACKLALELWPLDTSLDMSPADYVRTVKSLLRVFRSGGSDEALLELAVVLGADHRGARVALSELSDHTPGGQEPAIQGVDDHDRFFGDDDVAFLASGHRTGGAGAGVSV